MARNLIDSERSDSNGSRRRAGRGDEALGIDDVVVGIDNLER